VKFLSHLLSQSDLDLIHIDKYLNGMSIKTKVVVSSSSKLQRICASSNAA